MKSFKLKHTLDTLGAIANSTCIGAMAFLVSTAASAYSTVDLNVGGTTYTVAFTKQKTYNDCINAITISPWWGSSALAQQLASALGGALGAPTGGSYGPMFGFQTYGAGPNGVDNAAWSLANGQVAISNGNGWPVGTLGVYAVDPSKVDSAGNCTAADLATAAPYLQTVAPASGPMAGGTSITISGNNFTGATAVTIGGIAATSVTVLSDTSISAVTPANTSGAKSVLVTTSAGTSVANSLYSYTKLTQAQLSPSASPSTVLVGGSVALGSSGGSGSGAVSFAVTSGAGYCSVAGATLTGTAAGSCTVTVTKAADADYEATTATVGVTVNAAAVNGTCAVLPSTSFKPTAGLCSAGTLAPAGVLRVAGQWAWACEGANGGSSTAANACTTEFGVTGNNSGSASVDLSSVGGWVFAPSGTAANQTSGFISTTGHPKSPPNLPPSYSFPHALFDFVLTGGAGAATITITYPTAIPANAVYWKYGPSPAGYNCSGAACALPHWYQMPSAQAVIAGNTITLTIHDGGVGDDDLAVNGVIVDQGGPGVALAGGAGATAIPTMSEWAMLAMAALLSLFGFWHLRQRGRF